MTESKMAQMLRDYMEKNNISQAELARRAGVSTKHINQVFNGHVSARAAQLDYWAYCLGVGFTLALEDLAP